MSEENIWKNTDEQNAEPKKEEVKAEEPKKAVYAVKPDASKISDKVLTVRPDAPSPILKTKKDMWHELVTAMNNKAKLHGKLSMISETPNGTKLASVYYKSGRFMQEINIPLTELGLILSDDDKFDEDPAIRRERMTVNMLGCEIDFIIKYVDEATETVYASRREALLDNIKIHYAELDSDRCSRVHKHPHVDARVTAVGDKYIRVEVLGVQTQINATDVHWHWVTDLRDEFAIGEIIRVNVSDIIYPEPFTKCWDNEDWLMGIKIKCDTKSFEENLPKKNFAKVLPGSRSTGIITDIHNGTYFIQLENMVNAIAHSAAKNLKPLVGDEVSFRCIRRDENTYKAIGEITRIGQTKYY